jgi:prepilin-type N-terminal cleavage/methylation domain-containing protein
MPANTGTNRVSDSGFSIIEITVTIMIIATVLAFTIPMASNAVNAYNIRSAADHMAERIAAVRALAMARNRNVTFSFDNVTVSYGFDFDGTEGDGIPDLVDPDDSSIHYTMEALPSAITTTFPDDEAIKVTFNSRGEMPIGNTEKAIVLQSSGRTITVRVNLRGKISVE